MGAHVAAGRRPQAVQDVDSSVQREPGPDGGTGEGYDPQQTRHPSPQPQERDRGLQQTNQLQPPGPQIINCPVKSFSIKLSILSSILNYECAKIDILPLGHNLKPHSDISAGGMR